MFSSHVTESVRQQFAQAEVHTDAVAWETSFLSAAADKEAPDHPGGVTV